MRLTEAGRVFLAESRAVLQHAEDAVNAARAIATGGRGEVHVGYAPTLTARILPPALRAFQAGTSGVRVKLHDLSTEEMLAGLREGRLQIAFLVRPRAAVLRELRFEELMRDPLRLAVALNHPLARRRVVTLAEIAREPLIAYSRKDYPDYHEMLATVFSTTKSRPRIAEEHDGVSSLISAIEAGVGLALVPESLVCVAGARLKLLPLSPPPQPLVIGMASPKAGRTPAAERFLRCAQEAVSGR